MASKSKKKSKAKDEKSRGEFSAIEARSDDERMEMSPTVKSAPKKDVVDDGGCCSCWPWKRGPSKEELKNENMKLNEEIARLQQDLDEEQRRSQDKIARLQQDLNEERRRSQTEQSGLQVQVDQLETEKTELEEKLQQRQTEKSGLQVQVEQLQATKTELKEKLQQSQTEQSGLQVQVEQLQATKTELKEKLQQSQTEKDCLTEQVQKLEKEIKEKEERWQTEKDRLQQQVQDLKAETKELEKEIKKREERWQTQLQQCQAERDSARRAKDSWEAKTSQCQGEIRRLQEDINTKMGQLADYKHRLSEMASERMRQGNACVEDLNDPFRPTALADKWNGLFKTGEYWTAYSKAQDALKTDEDTAQFLYNVTRTVWKVCYEFIEDFVPRVLVAGPGPSGLLRIDSEKELHQQLLEKLPEVRRKLSELLPQDASRVDSMVKTLEEDYTSVRQTDIPSLQQKLRKALCLLPKTADPPELLAEKVKDAVHADENLNKDVRVDEKFLRKLAGLCYLMRLQEVPLFVSFDFTRGSSLDLSMFEVDGNPLQSLTDKVIKCILRPPLLRSEGGAVLSKGEADVEPAKSASDKAQDQSTALVKQNSNGTSESEENKRDKRNGEAECDENQKNKEAKDGAGQRKQEAAEVDGTETGPPPQDDMSDQDDKHPEEGGKNENDPFDISVD